MIDDDDKRFCRDARTSKNACLDKIDELGSGMSTRKL